MAELRTPQGHSLLLPDGTVSIGADPANEVPVAVQLGLAPFHFRLQPWEGGHFIEDAGSGLGTLVNGHAVHWKPLAHGDVITAGELEVIYSSDCRPEDSPALAVSPPVPATAWIAPPPRLNPPPPLVPPLPENAGAPSFPVHLPAQQLPMPSAAPLAPPPCWLPEDLLPEAYRERAAAETLSAANHPAGPAPEAPVPAGLPAPSAVQARRFSGRWFFPAATVLAMVIWAGLAAWQKGNLHGAFHSLRSAWIKTSRQDSLTVPGDGPALEADPAAPAVPPFNGAAPPLPVRAPRQ